MTYTIGCKVAEKTNNENIPYKITDGIYVFGKYGLPFICKDIDEIKNNQYYLYCINNLEDAQNYVRYLSRLYRQEFRPRAKKLGVSMDNFKFYLIKLETPEFGNFRKTSSNSAKDKDVKFVNMNNVKIISIK